MMDTERHDRPWVQLVGGTRPEAIKLAPLAMELERAGRIRPEIVASGQHPTMFEQGLAAFGLTPDRAVALHRTGGGQAELTSQLLGALDFEIERRRPAAVVVQGDTTTAMAAGMAAFWRQVPLVHLEAGLRSHDLASPFPEEGNRKLIAQLTTLHLAPTARAADNLYREGTARGTVRVVGNTVVDAVRAVSEIAPPPSDPALAAVTRRAESGATRLVVMTVHRRESWHGPIGRMLAAVKRLVADFADLEVVLPVHPNPTVRSQVQNELADCHRVVLTDPLDYSDLARLLSKATLVLSDSGGLQEEAPTFRVPVLVLRDVTERMEAVEAGCAVLVGSDRDLIHRTASDLLADPAALARMTSAGNPFGDGHAASRSEQTLAWMLGLQSELPAAFSGAHPASRRTTDVRDAVGVG